MRGSVIVQAYYFVCAENIKQISVLAYPPITCLRYHKDDILFLIDGVDGDEKWDESIIEIMENVSRVPSRTEYNGRGLMSDLASWARWARCDGQLFDSRHWKILPFSWIGLDFLHRGLWTGCGGVHEEECRGVGVHDSGAVYRTEIIFSMGTVAADNLSLWRGLLKRPGLFAYCFY